MNGGRHQSCQGEDDDDDGLLDRVQINKSQVNRFDLTNSLASRICRLCKQLNVFSR